MAELIDITGLDRAEVLAALYNRSKPQGMGFLHYDDRKMHSDEAAELLNADSDTYFDYLKGRVMKVRIPGPDDPQQIDPFLYDRDLGSGAAARVIEGLRRPIETNPIAIR